MTKETKVEAEFKAAIRRVPDFPKQGIIFRDITTLWKDGRLLRRCTDVLYEHYKGKKIDAVLGIEARGFVVGAPLAERLHVGFIPLRKLGKLPGAKISESYDLEYGTATLEMHRDAVTKGERILIVDDLIATGGYRPGGRQASRGTQGEGRRLRLRGRALLRRRGATPSRDTTSSP